MRLSPRDLAILEKRCGPGIVKMEYRKIPSAARPMWRAAIGPVAFRAAPTVQNSRREDGKQDRSTIYKKPSLGSDTYLPLEEFPIGRTVTIREEDAQLGKLP